MTGFHMLLNPYVSVRPCPPNAATVKFVTVDLIRLLRDSMGRAVLVALVAPAPSCVLTHTPFLALLPLSRHAPPPWARRCWGRPAPRGSERAASRWAAGGGGSWWVRNRNPEAHMPSSRG